MTKNVCSGPSLNYMLANNIFFTICNGAYAPTKMSKLTLHEKHESQT